MIFANIWIDKFLVKIPIFFSQKAVLKFVLYSENLLKFVKFLLFDHYFFAFSLNDLL